jgi:uncharacterized protein (UPF0332 family)
MTGHDFLSLAILLAAAGSEAERRTAISRAYYAAFHVARRLLEGLGFTPPVDEHAHKYLAWRLSNSGDPLVMRAGSQIDILRGLRNRADYDLRRTLSPALVGPQVRAAEQIVQTLDSLTPPQRTQITDAMKTYERDVLQEVTWHA